MLKRSLMASAVALTISAGQAHAASPFATIYLFGDSLSDVGNVYFATSQTQPANPYANGQFREAFCHIRTGSRRGRGNGSSNRRSARAIGERLTRWNGPA
jgi:phospholipase/lecithinase/hemolysin